MAAALTAQPASAAPELEARLDRAALPRHVAIIMDGNGRWGEANGQGRLAGHRAGVETIRRVVNACHDLGVGCLSLYSFSTENLQRPPEEVEALFNLFSESLGNEVDELDAKGVRIVTTGLIEWLPEELAAQFRDAEERTAINPRMTLNLCVMYSGRAEILDAARQLAESVRAGKFDLRHLDEQSFRELFYHPELPDPDLLIRTSGEQRISNFLLWQIAYSELVFSEVLWPDYTRADFLAALLEYQQRQRRFGGLG